MCIWKGWKKKIEIVSLSRYLLSLFISEKQASSSPSSNEKVSSIANESNNEHKIAYGATPEMSNLCLNSKGLASSHCDGQKTRKDQPGISISEVGRDIEDNDDRRKMKASHTSRMEKSGHLIHDGIAHAVSCSTLSCKEDDCYILKRFLLHQAACIINSSSGCSICIAFDAIVCKVSSYAENLNCAIAGETIKVQKCAWNCSRLLYTRTLE